MKITVVGGGRMGLPLACAFGKRGATVTVSDTNSSLVELLNAGRCPHEEPGLPELITHLVRDRRLRATTDTAAAVSESDAVVVIVPAHLTPERDIDLRILRAASADIGRGLRRGMLVVYETTVTIGATRASLIPVLEEQSGLKAGLDFAVGYSPERVKANLVLARLETTPKVVGGLNDEARERTANLYRTYLGAPIDDVGSLEAAEMTKLIGMLYRDVNIALANELATFCEIAGVHFERVRAAANRDGEATLLAPGIGVGGHCTPVYPHFLIRESRRRGMAQRMSETAREINDLQPSRQLARVAAGWRSLAGQRVHLLGLGFRPGVKVDSLSPAYALEQESRRLGASVTLEDPLYTDAEIRQAGFTPGAPTDAKLIVLNTAHEEFSRPNFTEWRACGVEAVLDGRNLWDQSVVEHAGLLYFGIGRSSRTETGGSSQRVAPVSGPTVSSVPVGT